MKKLILIFFVLMHVLDSFGQIMNGDFNGPTLQPCPFDSTQVILTPLYWFAYQTQNDKWDGPMDSTQCITFKDTFGLLAIELETVDITKPLFVKNLITDSTKVQLIPNMAYNQRMVFSPHNNGITNFSTSCKNGMCSGTIIGIEIPDSTGNGTTIREYFNPTESGLDDVWEQCVITERFDTSYLKEFVLKYSLLNPDPEDKLFAPDGVELFEHFYGPGNQINADVIVSEFSYSTFDSAYNGNIHDASNMASWWEDVHILMYKDSTYPSSDNPSFVEFFPPENDTIQQTINININQFQSLAPQPFANMRGGLVTGNDSLRHIVNLVNNGADLCVGFPFFELLMGDKTNYIHNSGSVDLVGKSSCMQFSRGSKLIVGEDAYLEYGRHGTGMLALRTGGSIELKKNATPLIDNTLIMHEFQEETESQQIFMELNKGTQLIFGEDAKIHNGYSINQSMKLNIFMNGGILDDANLTPEDRAKINRIYPEVPVQLSENIKVFPNPTSQFLNYSFVLENEEIIEIEMFDLTGRFIFSKKEIGQKGYNDLQINISNLNSGIYFSKIKMNQGEMISKITKM